MSLQTHSYGKNHNSSSVYICGRAVDQNALDNSNSYYNTPKYPEIAAKGLSEPC